MIRQFLRPCAVSLAVAAIALYTAVLKREHVHHDDVTPQRMMRAVERTLTTRDEESV